MTPSREGNVARCQARWSGAYVLEEARRGLCFPPALSLSS